MVDKVKQDFALDIKRIRQFQKSEKTIDDMVAVGWKKIGTFLPFLTKAYLIPSSGDQLAIRVEFQVKAAKGQPGWQGKVLVGRHNDVAATIDVHGQIRVNLTTGFPDVTAVATLISNIPEEPESKTKRIAYPDKQTSMLVAPLWTTHSYRAVCDYMRGVTDRPTAELKKLMTALAAYMKHSAPVAPTVPRGLSLQSPLVLWRGVQLSRIVPEIPKAGQTVTSNSGCYTAFSIDQAIAQRFAAGGYGIGAKKGFVYRLQADRIARGTPWIWFTDSQVPDLAPPRWKNALASTLEQEKEVLLPPGYFKVLAVSNMARVPVLDIAFVPQPNYVRSGAVPRLNGQGRAVTKTTTGNRLVLNHEQLRKNTQARRNAIASKVAASLRARKRKK